jgi:GAF domain-containing protein
MLPEQPEHQLTAAFVELADTLLDEFDVVDFLGVLTRRYLDLLGSAAVGIMLADQHGQLHVAASSSEQARQVELLALQSNEGPGLDAFRTATIVSEPSLAKASERWPNFSARAIACGFHSVHAIPLRLRDEAIGAVNLFGPTPDPGTPDPMTPERLKLAQAMADVATIGILHERAIQRAEVLAEQLQSALHSRVVIEQAKGVLAERGGIDMDTAFLALRGFARRNRLRLGLLARQVVDGTVDADPLLQAVTSPPRPSPGRTSRHT